MATHQILAAMDGTGSSGWRRADGLNSHVYRYFSDFAGGEDVKRYWHGPSTSGAGMERIAQEAFDWTLQTMERLLERPHCSQEDIDVCLVGHSRGAVAAMDVARRLTADSLSSSLRFLARGRLQAPVRVRFVGLYDAVDRALWVSPNTRLVNVEHCLHAKRKNISVNAERGSRGTFGTVDIEPLGRDHQFQTELFDTSHGGVGGSPGFFVPLDGMLKDFYCNALRLVLSRSELLQRYGMVGREVPQQRFLPLEGCERVERIRFLRRCLHESRRADRTIREAAVKAGFRFAGGASPHLPFEQKDEALWRRLMALLMS